MYAHSFISSLIFEFGRGKYTNQFRDIKNHNPRNPRTLDIYCANGDKKSSGNAMQRNAFRAPLRKCGKSSHKAGWLIRIALICLDVTHHYTEPQQN